MNERAAPPLRRRLRRPAAGAAQPRELVRHLPRATDSASDLARPGAALYGINPTPGRPNPMRPVVRLLRPRAAGARHRRRARRVGYNATWTARAAQPHRDRGVGYADGWHRSLSGRGRGVL